MMILHFRRSSCHRALGCSGDSMKMKWPLPLGVQLTPHDPRTFILCPCVRCSDVVLSNFLTRSTKRPIATGPAIVQRVMAQVTMRKISEGSPDCSARFAEALPAKTPPPSASEEMRYPISPRDTIAAPRMNPGYRDSGFSSGDFDCLRARGCCVGVFAP